MDDSDIRNKPLIHATIEAKCKEIGFNMPSDLYIGTLLKTLVTSKPGGNFLELGTGIGLSLAWMIDGMDDIGRIVSIDNDSKLSSLVTQLFAFDPRVTIVCNDGAEWIKNYSGDQFDLIFADTWPGKYTDLDETLALLKVGGIYVIDDMNEQKNWPEGHAKKATSLIEKLEDKSDFAVIKMDWSTGIILMAKIS